MFTTRNLFILIGKQSILAFVAMGVALIAVSFLASGITHVADTVVQNRILAEKLEKRTERFSVLAHDVAIVGTNDTALERAFVPADNILEFILALENLAFKNGTTQSFHFDTPVAAPEAGPFPLSTIGYQNTLTQNITSFSNYLRAFEGFPYFTRIDGLNFTAQDASGWLKGGTATYRAVLYTKTIN